MPFNVMLRTGVCFRSHTLVPLLVTIVAGAGFEPAT